MYNTTTNDNNTISIVVKKDLPLVRDQFMKKYTTTHFDLFCEIAFKVEKLDKLTTDIRITISAILEILGELDPSAKFIYYEEIPKRTPLTLIIEEEKAITDPL